MKFRLHVALLLLLSAFPLLASATCPPEGADRPSLQLLKQQQFAMADDVQRNALALGLLDCLGDPDPAMRDGIAYEALTAWLRANQLDDKTRLELRERLYAMLKAPDEQGFQRPFAALVLSEVARTDRITPWMKPRERAAMVKQATAFLSSVEDYRGFSSSEGWRHGVAHGADWLLQLATNEQVDHKQVDAILAALASQIVPHGAHAYVFGEPGRLARPLLSIARRGVLTPEQWQSWFASLPPRLGDAPQAYTDETWLARRHDLMAFLSSLYLEADQSSDERIRALKPRVVETIKQVP